METKNFWIELSISVPNEFVDLISDAGAKRFAIHARKALLNGLSPKENRTIPPLQHERVAYIKNKELLIK